MQQASASVVVVEQGAEFGAGAQALLAQGGSDRVMVVQQPGETPAELALRVRRRTDLLRHSGTGVGQALIAAGDHTDDQTFQARCQIARALLSAMTADEPELTFSASRRLSPEARHELLAIAGTLTGQLHGTPIQVSVRFGEPARAAESSSPRARYGRFEPDPVLEVA